MKKEIITGGIHVFVTKDKNAITPLNSSFAWVDTDDKDPSSRIILFGMFGPNEIATRMMKNIFKTNVDYGKSKIIKFNDKISSRTSIDKKHAFNLSVLKTSECKEEKGQISFETSSSNNMYNYSVDWKSQEVCMVNDIKIDFSDSLKNIKINKIINGKTYKNIELKYNKANLIK